MYIAGVYHDLQEMANWTAVLFPKKSRRWGAVLNNG
jgi:hypothetical protein